MFQNNFLPWSTQMWVNIPRIDSLRALPIVFCEAYRNDDNWARGGAWNWMALDQLEEKSPGLGKRKKNLVLYKSPNWWIPLEFWGQKTLKMWPISIFHRWEISKWTLLTKLTKVTTTNTYVVLKAASLIAVLSPVTAKARMPGWYDSLGCSFTRHLTLTYVGFSLLREIQQVFQSNSDIVRCWHFTLACKLQEKDDRVNSHIWQENLMKAWIVRWPIRLPKDSEAQHIQKTSIAIPFVV